MWTGGQNGKKMCLCVDRQKRLKNYMRRQRNFVDTCGRGLSYAVWTNFYLRQWKCTTMYNVILELCINLPHWCKSIDLSKGYPSNGCKYLFIYLGEERQSGVRFLVKENSTMVSACMYYPKLQIKIMTCHHSLTPTPLHHDASSGAWGFELWIWWR